MMIGEIVVYSSMSKKLYTVLTKKPYVSDIGFFFLNNKTCTVLLFLQTALTPEVVSWSAQRCRQKYRIRLS